ncbi:MAG: serine/threonine-protein kinase [Planctomycetota bacterium]
MPQSAPDESIEFVIDRFTEELNRGDVPSIDEYVRQYPGLAESLRDVLPSIVAIQAEPNASPVGHANNRLQLRPGREFGEYRIVSEIGFGGMGVVYEAIHQPLQRRVALKVMSPQLSDKSHRQRFAIEARAAASLHHTHIVPVFETGDFHGMPYIALQFIDGISLEKLIRDDAPSSSHQDDTDEHGSTQVGDIFRAEGQSDSPSGRDSFVDQAKLGSQIADAISHAHEHGVLHRDIKPSNVIVDQQGDAWVTDFGLAKLDDQDFTRSGDLIGTLRYMAPERFDGRCDQRSEVYSLGMLMYELVAKRSPFAAGDRAETMKQIAGGNRTPISDLVPNISRDLETIIEKATQQLPEDRYVCAAAFAEDLRRFRVGLPIVGDKLSHMQRLVRWCKRNPAVASLGSALAVSLLLWFASLFAHYRSTVRTNLLLTGQNIALEASYESEREAKLEAESNLRANAVTVDFLMRLFRSPDPARDGRKVTLSSQLQDAFQELSRDNKMPWENRVALLQAVGVSLGSLGLVKESVEALQMSDRLQAEHAPPDSARRLITRAHLGSSLILAGRFADALSVLEPTWKSSQTVFGEFDSQTRSVANLLADAMRNQNRAEEAIGLLQPIRSWETDHVRGPTEATAKTLNNLALALKMTGKDDEAVDLMSQCVAQQETLHGADDPRTLMARNNLGNFYGQFGRIVEAESLIKQVYESRRRVLGPDHHDTLNSQNGLAGIYMSTGKLAEALSVIKDVVDQLRKKLGDSHPQTVMTSYNMGVLQLRTDDYRAALNTFDTCVERMNKFLGRHHPTVIKSRRYSARCHHRLGNTETARDELARLIEDLESNGIDENLIDTVRKEMVDLESTP